MSNEMETEGTAESETLGETNQNGNEADSFAHLSNNDLAKLLERRFNSDKNADFLKTTVLALATKVWNGTEAGPYASLIDRLYVEDLPNGNITDSMKETAGDLCLADETNALALQGGFKDEEEKDTGIIQKQSLFDPDSVSNKTMIEDIVKHGKDLKKVTDVPQSASSTRRHLRQWIKFARKILQKWKEDGNHNTSQDGLLPLIQQAVTYLEETEQQEPNLFKFEYWWRFAWVLENQDKFSSDAEIGLLLVLCSVTAGRDTKAAKVAGVQGKYSKKRKQPGSDADPTSGET